MGSNFHEAERARTGLQDKIDSLKEKKEASEKRRHDAELALLWEERCRELQSKLHGAERANTDLQDIVDVLTEKEGESDKKRHETESAHSWEERCHELQATGARTRRHEEPRGDLRWRKAKAKGTA